MPAGAQVKPRYSAFTPTTAKTIYPLRQLAPGVFVVSGDTGKGVEGRPNAGFIDSPAGVLVVGGLASPVQGDAVVRTIRTRSSRPIRWFVLYAHHPDMQFGAIAMKRAGAGIIAHPDANILAAEGGPDQMVADWDQVVGLQEMLGFEFADVPDRPVTAADTLVLGTRRVVVWHPGDAHSPGDLMLWLPDDRILFAGDVLVEDGVTMVIDGSSRELLRVLEAIEQLHPRVIVPGHGRIAFDPQGLIDTTRGYIAALRAAMRAAVEGGVPMRRALAPLPPADEDRPVSLHSRLRRNANRVYVEMEREVMGLGGDQDSLGGKR
ncbi:MAG: beta-lactamase domain protein [Gemmatimonadetes bacterium]|nr:beta-lactamase domain protein [Gemmatimonadota bacterium]